MLESPVRVRAFYDLDTPVTLDVLARDGRVEYLAQAAGRISTSC
jgi:hypothetical protein